MDLYGDLRRGGRQGINDPSNIMLLRADLHRAWDKMLFIHTPKRSTTGELVFVTNILVYSKELVDLYHNAELHPLGVARECLFARFAWAIFPLLSGFLQQGHGRYLLRADSKTSKLISAYECFEHSETWKPANQRLSRTPSPTKRPRRDAGMDDNVTEDDETAKEGARQALHTHLSNHNTASKPSTIEQSCPQQEVLDLTTSPSTPDGSNSPTFKTMQGLYRSALEAERARSDPEGRWRKLMEIEQQWLDGILEDGGAVDASEMPRMSYTSRRSVSNAIYIKNTTSLFKSLGQRRHGVPIYAP
ncbi:MAG: hypothetical protein Q9196_001096 [Gyalolechia fulgens]